MNKRNNSGQIIIVAVLIIALALVLTELYVYDLGDSFGEANPKSFSDAIFAVELGSKHVVVGSLANVSRGGANQTLANNLESWKSFIEEQYQLGRYILNFTPSNTPPYSSGIWISWGNDGLGVSGAHANLSLAASDEGVNVELKPSINITSTIHLDGVYRVIQSNSKQINLTCNVSNEGRPALARNITVYYRNGTNWLNPGPQNNYTVTDYGNGTYFLSFAATIPSETVEASLRIYDQREICVKANVTCAEI